MNPYVVPGIVGSRTPLTIAQVVADYYGLTANKLYGVKSRKTKYLQARQLVQAILIYEDYSIRGIAKMFGIKRATIYNNCMRIVERMQLYSHYRNEYADAMSDLEIEQQHFYYELIKKEWIKNRLK